MRGQFRRSENRWQSIEILFVFMRGSPHVISVDIPGQTIQSFFSKAIA